jgi:hypothetical protein
LGWPPFLRIHQGAKFRPAGPARWDWRRELVGQVGQRWRGCGTALRSRDGHLECPRVAWWGEGHEAPWFLLTDVAPAGCDASGYGRRTWCAQRCKGPKRGGWQGQYTHMTVPARAARLWLALAVATLWRISVGSDREVGPPRAGADLPDLSPLLDLPAAGKPRRTRLFRLGWLWVLVCQITARPLPRPWRLVPEPWPNSPICVGRLPGPSPAEERVYG